RGATVLVHTCGERKQRLNHFEGKLRVVVRAQPVSDEGESFSSVHHVSSQPRPGPMVGTETPGLRRGMILVGPVLLGVVVRVEASRRKKEHVITAGEQRCERARPCGPGTVPGAPVRRSGMEP